MRKKDRRFELEGEIIKLVFQHNQNTPHFDYHVDIDDVDNSIELDLYTRNARNGMIFLLHQTHGTSSVDVLRKMLDYLHSQHQGEERNSYTVRWKDKRDPSGGEQTSYFYEHTEEEVLRKFFYNRSRSDFEVRVELNPIA